MTNNETGEVIPIWRSAQEVRKLATKHLAQGQPLTAAELLRLSLEKEPNVPETVIRLAEAYADMHCWTLSNNAYFSLVQNEEWTATCFYGLGRNYYTMQVYSLAHDCLLLAMQKRPQDSFTPDALEMVESIGEMEEPPVPVELMIHRRMERVLDAMDKGSADLATRQIRRVLALGKRSHGIRSLQAFALVSAGKPKEALTAARAAYRLDRSDVRALTSMASALRANQSFEAAHAFLLRASDHIENEEEAQLVCQTACEMGEHAYAAEMLLSAEQAAPYSDELLHPLAVALHNAKQHDEAIRRWRLLRRIDPMDSVAAYRLAQAEDGTLPPVLPYARQVPLPEMLRRLEQLRIWVHEGREALLARMAADDSLLTLLKWGLTCGEWGIPQAACNVLGTIANEQAQALLREVLCDINAPAALKQSALAALYQIGADGPYYAMMEDRLTLVHVSRPEGGEQKRSAEAIAEKAGGLLGVSDAQHVQLQALASAAIVHDRGLDDSVKVRAVIVAYCTLTGQVSPLSSTSGKRRKIDRLARRILKEDGHEMH